MSTEQVLTELAAVRSELKSIKRVLRKVREFQEDPDGEKAKARAANNGFNRPQNVSDELRGFLKLGEGEQISRSEVTKRVNAYIREKGLKDADNGRQINMDASLRSLLSPPEGETVTFLNLQRFLNKHYIKEGEQPKEEPKKKVVKKKRVVKKKE